MNRNKVKKMAVLLNETFYPILKESIRGKVSKEDGLNIAVALLSNLDENQGLDKLMKEACESTNNMIKENFLLSVHHASNIKEKLFRENVLEVVKAVKADRVEDIVTERFEALKNINLAHAPEEGDELTPDVGTGEADDDTTVVNGGLNEDFSANTDAMEEELGIDGFENEDGTTEEVGDFDEMGLDGDSADIFNTDSTADEGDFSFEGEGGDEDFSFSDDSEDANEADTEEATEDEIHKESIRRFRESVVYLNNVKSINGGDVDAMVQSIATVATEEGSEVVATVAAESTEGKVTNIVKTAINTIQTYLSSPSVKDLNIIGELTLVAKLLGHAVNNVIEEGINNLYSNEIGMLKKAMDEIDGLGAKYSIARGYLGLYIQVLEEKIGMDEDVVFNNAAENHIVQATPVAGDIAVSYVIAETDNFHKNADEGSEGLICLDDVVSTPESFKNYLNDSLSYMGEGAPLEIRNLIGQIVLAVDVSVEEILSAIIVSFGNVVNYNTEERKALREVILTTLVYCHSTGRGLDTLLAGDNEVATKIMSVLYLTVNPTEDAIVEEAPMGDSEVIQNTPVEAEVLETVVDETIEADVNETSLIKEAATYKIDPNLVTYEEIENMVNALEANDKAFYTDEELKAYGTELNDIYGKVISGGQPIFKKLKALDFGRRCVDMLKPSSKLSDAVKTRLSSGKNPVTKLGALTDDVLKYASRSGLIALSMLAPVAGIAVATFAVIARMLSQREKETSRKVINHEIAKLNVAKSMAKDKEVEEYLDTIISHYTKILQYVEGNYNANKEISGIRKAVESLLKRNRKQSKKIIKESRVNRIVAKESATQIYRECCLSSTLSNYESIFKNIIEAVLKGELSGAETIEAVTNSLTDATKSYMRLVEYKLSNEPNEEASALLAQLVSLLTREGLTQTDLVTFILDEMKLTAGASNYRGLLAIPFAYLAMYTTAEDGITVDQNIIAQHLADLQYLDTAKAYAVQVIASLAGNENALKYDSFDVYSLESAKVETESSTEDVEKDDLYGEAYGKYRATISGSKKHQWEFMLATSDDFIKLVKDAASDMDDVKLTKRVKDNLRRMQDMLDSQGKASYNGNDNTAYRANPILTKLKGWFKGMQPIIDSIRTKKSLDASTERDLLQMLEKDVAIDVGTIMGAYMTFVQGILPIIPFLLLSRRAHRRRNESFERVIPKVLIKLKAKASLKDISDAERTMYELMLMHVCMMVQGAELTHDKVMESVTDEYGLGGISDFEKIIDKKFKELKALSGTTKQFREAPHAMGDITVNTQLKGIKKLNQETIDMVKDIAAGNVDKYRMDEKMKAQLKKFYDNAAYMNGEVKGIALLTGLGPKFEKTVQSFGKKVLEFIGGAFPIIDSFRSQANMEKEIEAKILQMINPIQSLSRNLGTLAIGVTGIGGQLTASAVVEDIKRLAMNQPMKNPIITGLSLLNVGVMMLYLVGSATSERKRRKALVNVCERLEYKFKALATSKKIAKEEKDIYELMLMHIMLVHKHIDPEKYTAQWLSGYTVNLEDDINAKFDEIVKSIGAEKSFKEACGQSIRVLRENAVLSRLARRNSYKENAIGDIEYVGGAVTDAIVDLITGDSEVEEEVTAEAPENVLGDTFEDVTELVVEEPAEPVAMVATAITENIADNEVAEGGEMYSEVSTAARIKVTNHNFVSADGVADQEAIIAMMNDVSTDKRSLFKPSMKLAKKFVELVNYVGARTLGNQGNTNMGIDVLLSDSANSSEFRKAFFGECLEYATDKFGGILATKSDYEYALTLALYTPIMIAELNKGLSDYKKVTRVSSEVVGAVDAFTTSKAYKGLNTEKKQALLDVKSALTHTFTAKSFKESADRDYSHAIAAISTYAIGLDTLLNEKGNSKEFIASMLRK